MKILQAILFFISIPFVTESQVLLQLHDNARHTQIAPGIRKQRIKSVNYEYEMPSLLNMTFSAANNTTTELTIDTIIHVDRYLENGLIELEQETFTDGSIRYSKQYAFDAENRLSVTREANRKPVRYYDYQEMAFHYSNGQISRIDKMRFEAADTVRSTTAFSYDENNLLVKVVETDNLTGDTLLSSFLKYYPKDKYIEEQSFIRTLVDIRTIYYYDLDRKGRVVKVSRGLDGYKKDLDADRWISYNLSKDIPKPRKGILKIEKWDNRK